MHFPGMLVVETAAIPPEYLEFAHTTLKILNKSSLTDYRARMYLAYLRGDCTLHHLDESCPIVSFFPRRWLKNLILDQNWTEFTAELLAPHLIQNPPAHLTQPKILASARMLLDQLVAEGLLHRHSTQSHIFRL